MKVCARFLDETILFDASVFETLHKYSHYFDLPTTSRKISDLIGFLEDIEEGTNLSCTVTLTTISKIVPALLQINMYLATECVQLNLDGHFSRKHIYVSHKHYENICFLCYLFTRALNLNESLVFEEA